MKEEDGERSEESKEEEKERESGESKGGEEEDYEKSRVGRWDRGGENLKCKVAKWPGQVEVLLL